jgi:uncharacterized protein (DUF2236 family)
VLTVTFGDVASAESAGALVRRVHRGIVGVDPVTGKNYSADDPDTLLFVHCAEVHSFLAAYRAYASPLTEEQQDEYFSESARSASLVGIPRDRVPKNTAEMREYFARVRPSLCLSQAALDAIRFVAAPPIRRGHIALGASMRVVSSAAVGLMPRHLRALAGLERSAAFDAATYAAVRTATLPLAVALGLPFAAQRNLSRLRRLVVERPFVRDPGLPT